MIELRAGTLKFLLMDQAEIDRNAERRKEGTPIAMVFEVSEDRDETWTHRGYFAIADGPTWLRYSQHDAILSLRPSLHDEMYRPHAAYCTRSAVRIAETPDEAVQLKCGIPAKAKRGRPRKNAAEAPSDAS